MNESVSSDSTSSTLLERARQHDDIAWSKIARLYGPRIYAWARQAGLQEADALDVGQEVFRLLANKLEQFDRRRTGSFRAWLFKATQNTLQAHLRRRQRQPQPMGDMSGEASVHEFIFADDPSSFESIDVEQAFVHRLLEIVRQDFSERTWTIFWRTTVEDCNTADLAAEFGMTAKAVRQARYRVFKRLRQELEELT